jgi:hypothetical protein
MSRTDARNALLCAAAVTLAFFLVNPFVEMPFDDDWSYAFTVRQFLATGHLVFNGWSAPLLITQAWWGALYCKIFGFSFVTLRFSMLPFDIGCAVFAYLLARRCNLTGAAAVCVSLTLCLSPLFLPLGLSFMTDVPAMCGILVSLYALARAAQSPARSGRIGWLVIGAAVGILGGMGRQTVWLAPICGIPLLLLMHRRDKVFLFAAIVAWLAVVADVVICLRWLARQPNGFIDPSIIECLRKGVGNPPLALSNIVKLVLTTVLLALPACLAIGVDALRHFWWERRTWRSALAAVVILLCSIWFALHPAAGMMPWMFNIVTTRGVIGALELSGARPVTLPLVVQGILSALVLAVCFLVLARAIVLAINFRATLRRMAAAMDNGRAPALVTIFALAYFALMVIRSCQDLMFDRYCLPLIPCLAILALRRRAVGAGGWLLLGIYAAYALASTQDVLALAEARRAAIDRLRSSGVPATQIAGGFEYDFFTQLDTSGVINRFDVRHPTMPYASLGGYTPAIKPRYRLEYPRMAGMKPSRFGEVEYRSWIWPFRRVLLIDEFVDPWWLDPVRSANRGVPFSFEGEME